MSGFADRYGPWAVVTGAAQGVGLAFTEELAERGVGVVMVDRSPDVEDAAAGVDGDTRTLVADVADRGWIDALARAADGLEVGLAVANAGVGHVGPFAAMDAGTRDLILDVNCRGTVDLMAWALPPMLERGRGGLVATSSGSALVGTAGVALYSATKAFSVNLMEAVGWEVRDRGVDALAVVAPSMDTPTFRGTGPDHERMLAPPTDPREVVAGALDALPEGGRWLADEGLRLAAGLERAQLVDLMGETIAGMYHDILAPTDPH